jgi:hypothetical protein
MEMMYPSSLFCVFPFPSLIPHTHATYDMYRGSCARAFPYRAFHVICFTCFNTTSRAHTQHTEYRRPLSATEHDDVRAEQS